MLMLSSYYKQISGGGEGGGDAPSRRECFLQGRGFGKTAGRCRYSPSGKEDEKKTKKRRHFTPTITKRVSLERERRVQGRDGAGWGGGGGGGWRELIK